MFLAFAVHSVVSPGTFILSSIRHVENAPTISLAIPMLTHIPHELRIQRNTESRHLVVFEHALIAEVIIKKLGTDPVHFIGFRLCVQLHLAVINIIAFLDSDKIILDVAIGIDVNLRIVVVHYPLRVRNIPKPELDLINRFLNLRQQLVSFKKIPLL